MTKTLFVSDLDGTLLNEKQISAIKPRTYSTI